MHYARWRKHGDPLHFSRRNHDERQRANEERRRARDIEARLRVESSGSPLKRANRRAWRDTEHMAGDPGRPEAWRRRAAEILAGA